jgi:tetratricopeptide (TPR) repeat protein
VRRDLLGAQGLYREARSVLAGSEPTPLLANLLRWEGSVLRDMGKPDGADELYEESLRVSEACGSVGAQASAVNCRAAIAQRRGDVEGALTLYRSAARLAAEAGAIRLTAMIEQNIGVLANIRGDLNEAHVHYRMALTSFQAVRDDEGASWVLNNLGMVLNDLAMPSRAEDAFTRGLAITRAREDRPLEGILLTNYAESLIAMQRWEEATTALDTALAIVCEGEDVGRAGQVLKLRGVLERERGLFPQAMGRFREALGVATSVHDRLLAAEVLRERGELHFRFGDGSEAKRDWTHALEAFEAVGAKVDAAYMRTRLAELTNAEPSGNGP